MEKGSEVCAVCDGPLPGRQKKYCGDLCRKSALAERQRQRYRADREYRELMKDRARAYAAANGDKVAAYEKTRLDSNRRHVRLAYARDPGPFKTRAKTWAQQNPEKAKEHARRKARQAREMDQEYAAILRRDPCSYCGGPGGEVDHIVPPSKGGTGHWTNLTAACKSCNSSKNARSLLHFMLERLEDQHLLTLGQ